MPAIVVVIPAFNEEDSIGRVLGDIPRDLVGSVIVANNGSTDGTRQAAEAGGAVVVDEPRRGYGQACLTGMDKAAGYHPDIIVFLDGDYSDYPEDMREIVQPIVDGRADFVLGSRILGERETGAMVPQAYWGNKFCVWLMRLFFGVRFTDLGPFRAITWPALLALNMADRNFGWTAEMQVKAALRGIRILETPVRYRKRIGTSKVSGTVSGTIKAGYKILYTIFKGALLWRN